MKTLYLYIFLIFFSVSFLEAQWVQTEGPLGGDSYCINRVGNEIWCGTNIGIHVSNNNGYTWEKSSVYTKSCIEIFCHHDTIIMITAERDTNNLFDEAIFKSNISYDGGSSWLGAVLIEANPGYCTVYNVQSTLIMIGYYDIHISYDYGLTWSIMPTSADLQWLIVDEPNIVAAISSSLLVTYYISYDAANTWVPLAQGYYSTNLILKDSLILVYSAYNDTLNHGYIIRSDNYGLNWDTVFVSSPGFPVSNVSDYLGMMYAGVGDSVWTSNDEGFTWSLSNVEEVPYIGDTVELSNGNFLDINTTEGVLYHDVINDTIYPSNTGIKNMVTYEFKCFNSVLYAYDAHDLYYSSDAGQVWQKIKIPDTQSYQTALTDFYIVGDTILATKVNYLLKSFDHGITWDTVALPLSYYSGSSTHIARHNNRLYINTDSLYYTDDLGLSWSKLPDLPVMSNPGPFWCTSQSSQYGKMDVFNDTLFVVSNDGYIFRYDELSGTWIYCACQWMYTNLMKVDDYLVASKGDEELIVSSDNGLTWSGFQPVGLPLDETDYPMCPYHIISINNVWFGSIYNTSVYYSTDDGYTWQPVDVASPLFAPYGELAELNGVLFSGSYYRSVWRRNGTFNDVSGRIFRDNNANGIIDIGEEGIEGIIVELEPFGLYASSDTAGFYSLLTDATGDTLKPVLDWFLSSIPEYYIVNGPSLNNNFGINAVSNISDLEIDLTNISVFRPGFETIINITARNSGSLAQSGEVKVLLDTALYYISAVPSYDYMSGDTLIWNLSALNYCETFHILLTTITSLNLNFSDSIHCLGFIDASFSDINPVNNWAFLNEEVVNSFDPNDKTCINGIFITPDQVQNGEDMVFIVRFQNTGNYPASFIHIIDTLSHYLNPATLQVLSSSHPVELNLYGQGIIDFYFDNINLPPSLTDEAGSHGYVKFSVKCKETVVLGHAITNTAYIYFDYNSPIVTNTTTTVVSYPIPAEIFKDIMTKYPELKITVYPNPVNRFMNISVSGYYDNDLFVNVFSSEGKIVKSSIIDKMMGVINLELLNDGIYYGAIINTKGEYIGSFRFMKKCN